MVTLATARADDPDGTTVPKAAFLEAADYLDQFASATNDEMFEYDRQLTNDIAEIVRRRRARLATIAAQNLEVVGLLRRPLRALEVTFPQPPDAEPAVEVHLAPLLKRATFSGLVDVTCRWRSGVEKYPAAFSQLDEDSLSSLLVATLNVAFDTAQREVFNLEGKTDIYVEAVHGQRENAAYFGEAKMWNGQAQVAEHMDQLFRYTGSRTEEAMLLYYVKALDLAGVQSACRGAMEKLGSVVTSDDGNFDRVTLTHPRFGQQVDVSTVYIHLPFTAS